MNTYDMDAMYAQRCLEPNSSAGREWDWTVPRKIITISELSNTLKIVKFRWEAWRSNRQRFFSHTHIFFQNLSTQSQYGVQISRLSTTSGEDSHPKKRSKPLLETMTLVTQTKEKNISNRWHSSQIILHFLSLFSLYFWLNSLNTYRKPWNWFLVIIIQISQKSFFS